MLRGEQQAAKRCGSKGT